MMKLNRAGRLLVLSALLAASVAVAGRCADSTAKIVEMSGAVKMKASDPAAWQPAKTGSTLKSGAMIRCEKDSWAVIIWQGNTMKVRPMSRLRIDKLHTDIKTGKQDTSLSLMEGQVFTRAKKVIGADSVFNIKTPTAIAGVRGTDFGVSFSPQTATMLAVLAGSVSVAAGGVEVTVGEGQMSSVAEGMSPSEPASIPPDMMQEMTQEIQHVAQAEATFGTPEAGKSETGSGSGGGGKDEKKEEKADKKDEKKDSKAEKKEEKAEKKEEKKEEKADKKEEKSGASTTASSGSATTASSGSTTTDSSESESADSSSDDTGASDADVQSAAESAVTSSVNDSVNNDIATQGEMFEGCCTSR